MGIGNLRIVEKLEILEKSWKFEEKNLKFWKDFRIWKKIESYKNLYFEKIWNYGENWKLRKILEICKKKNWKWIGNEIWKNLETQSLKIGKKNNFGKICLKFKKKNWKKSSNFGKILKIGKNLKFGNNFEIWKEKMRFEK